jgi:hypothetical protein
MLEDDFRNLTRSDWSDTPRPGGFGLTKEGEIVWEFVNPYFGKPFFGGPPTSESNQVFRAIRYTAEDVAKAMAAG